MLNQYHIEYQWQTLQFSSKSKQMAFHHVLQSVYFNWSVTSSVLLNSSFTPCRRIKLLWHWLQQLASCVIHEKKKKIKEVNPIFGCRKPTLAFALNPDGLMYMLCVACAKMYMLMKKIPHLSHSRWQTRVADETCFFCLLLFSKLRPYENNYRARDDWLWWGRRWLTGANILSLQILTFIESQFVIVSALNFEIAFWGFIILYAQIRFHYASSPALMVSATFAVKYMRMQRPLRQ